MKPKIFVAAALMIAILAAGLTLIMGFSSTTLLPVYLVSFLLIFFAATIYIMRDILGDKAMIASVMLFMLALGATFFLTSYKTYQDVSNAAYDDSAQISLMQSENDYYIAYADYLNRSIILYQNQTQSMEDRLKDLEKIKAAQDTAQQTPTVEILNSTPQITVPETSYITYPDYVSSEGNDD